MGGLFLVTILAVSVDPMVEAAKILLVPLPVYSHCLEISGVGQGLADRGHQVYILLGSTFSHRGCYDNFRNGTNRIVPITFTDSPKVTPPKQLTTVLKKATKEGEEFSFLKEAYIIHEFSRTVCNNLFFDKEGFEKLKAIRVDLAIVDFGTMASCYFVLPYKLGVPYVAIGTFIDNFLSGRPFLPSIIPNSFLTYTNSMTFLERITNALSFITYTTLSTYMMAMDALDDIAPELSRRDLLTLASNCELYLYNYDVTLAYPVPVMPNHVFIGGITAGPVRPLPTSLELFYNKSKRVVVLVTFGSGIGSIPKNRENILKGIFKTLDADVLWKYDTEGEDGNIKYVKWLPQNDLLGQTKTKLFVSHCGNNGVFEALYHGVPVVCTPVYGDQFHNGVRVQHWKAGKTVSLMAASEEEMYEAINTVFTDPMYSKNMKKASEMYHSQPMTAHERAAFWVEYLLKFGGSHLKSKASEMSTITYMGYDLVCCVVCSVVFVLLLVVKCTCVCYRCSSKRFVKLKTS